MKRVLNWLKSLKLNQYDDRDTRRLIWAGEYKPAAKPAYILDLGAHKGFAAEYFAKEYPETEIHSYEPNARLYKKLVVRASAYPNIKTFNEAISDRDGTVKFYISNRNVSSSLFGNGMEIEVPCISLRTAVSRTGSDHVFVKIDIEGAEFDALKDIPQEIDEIAGEAHPEKAGRTMQELKDSLTAFDATVTDEGKSLFRATRRT